MTMTRVSPAKLIIPGIIGNVLEWYDFSLYGYFAPVIAKLFFPTEDKFLSLLTTFGVFALGFLMRPLGAAIFGHFGDRVGRKKVLAAAIILMAIPTTLIGLLPTYQSVGPIAGVMLLVCRLLQGLAVGGEFSGSIVYITEHSPNHRRGFFGSLAMFSAFAGLLLGSAVSAFTGTFMTHDALVTWGWRVPFLIGFLLGFIGLYLRLRMPETPNFNAIKEDHKILVNPVGHAFKEASLPMFKAVGLVFLPAMGFYLLFVYLSTYMTTYLKIPLDTALTINSMSMVVILIVIPLIGILSDKIGRKPILIIGALGFVIFSYPLFLLLQQGTFAAMLLAQSCFAILVSFAYAAIPATLVELVATNIRYSAMSLPYNVANTVFGGTAPLVATLLIGTTGNHSAPSFYLIIAGIIMFIFTLSIRETYNKTL